MVFATLLFVDGSSEQEVVEEGRLEAPEKPRSRTAERWLLAFAVISLIISLASLALLVVDARTQWRLHDLLGAIVLNSNPSEERPDPGLLERPNVYSALDKLPQEVSQAALPDTLAVFPPFFQPVDHIHRNYVFPSDGHARFTFNGRVSPGDHRVLLTDHVRICTPRSILRYLHLIWHTALGELRADSVCFAYDTDHDGSSIPCT